jgi:hypothetical protein
LTKPLKKPKAGKDGYAVWFQNGAECTIVDTPKLLPLYRSIASSIKIISVSSPAFPLEFHLHTPQLMVSLLMRSVLALLTLFAFSSTSCVQLHFENFNITDAVSDILCQAIAQLTELQSFYFEGNRGTEASYAYLFRSLSGKLPNLRHLYLPEMRLLHSNHRPSECPCFYLKQLVVGCPKLVYFDVSYSKLTHAAYTMILNICELNRSIQVLNLWNLAGTLFVTRDIYNRMSSGRLNLLDIIFGYDKNNEWKHFKNRMNVYFSLNKEKRERRPLLESLHSFTDTLDANERDKQIPILLSELGTKREGTYDIYCALRNDVGDLIKIVDRAVKRRRLEGDR